MLVLLLWMTWAQFTFTAQKGHVEVVRTLISFGVSVKSFNRKGLTALHYAAQGSHLKLVKYLVKKGASLSAKNKAGKTALDLASNDEIRAFLLECESLSKQGHKNGNLDVEESQSKIVSKEKADASDGDGAAAVTEDKKDEPTKRKGAEDDEMEKVTELKKATVALNHLLASDDAQDEEENC